MKLWYWVGLGIWLVFSYLAIPGLFWLSILFIVLWVFYRLYHWLERYSAPPGKRIKHGLLRGHLMQEYGTQEGGKLYKEMVSALRKRGYR